MVLLTRREILLVLGSLLAGVAPAATSRRPPLVSVRINDQGPFQFLADSAASVSVLSAAVTARLGLPEAGTTTIHQSTGMREAGRVKVESLSAGPSRKEHLILPTLEFSRYTGLDGVLGLDVLAGQRLALDFEQGRGTITESVPGSHGLERIRCHRHRSGLLQVDVTMGRRRIPALVDTGADRSFGSISLLPIFAPANTRLPTILHAGIGKDQKIEVLAVTASKLDLAGRMLPPQEILIADLAVFQRLKMSRRPALLLGSDLLSAFGITAIDFRHRELQRESSP